MNPANYSTINANSDKLEADRIFGFSSFTKSENEISIFSTTTNNGHRTRQTCGFFTSQNSHNGRTTPIYAEFGARLICGNKPSNRTNNASRLLAVVETLPHPIKGEANPFTKTNKRLFQMKTPTPQANTASNQTITPSLSENSGFTSGQISAKFRTAVLNQTASRRKLNLKKANSTPNRAFFVRSIRTPQERLETLSGSERLSMVGRRGQPLAVGYLPFSIVSYPFTSYRQAVGSEAVSLNNLKKDTAMIYQFLCVNRNTKPYLEEVVQVQAINEDEARWQLTAEHALLATVGRYPDHQTQQATDRTARLNARLLAKFRPNLTACEVAYA